MRISLIAALLLVGCAAPQKPVIQTEQVERVVTVKCVDSVPDVPKYALGTIPQDASVLIKGNAALAEIKQREAFQAKLLAILTACATPTDRRP